MRPVEPFRSRWQRRVRTVPVMLGLTAAALVGLGPLVVGGALYDLARLRFRLPTVRVLLFVVRYGINDSIEILAAPLLWLRAGFGTGLDGPASIRRHERIQTWSVASLARWADRLLGLRPELDAAGAAALAPGPVIVLCRHVNLVDASLPSVLYQRLGFRVRGVIMAELLADPGFDLIYGRTGSVFIPRDNGPEARVLVAGLGRDLDATTAVVLFPEGRLYRPDVAARALERLGRTDPQRAAGLAGLRHVLPPRPGGFEVLLDTLPGADVVVMAHAGLDRHPSFRHLAAAVPLTTPIAVTAWRTPAADVPTTPTERVAWLDDQWRRVDDWVAARTPRA